MRAERLSLVLVLMVQLVMSANAWTRNDSLLRWITTCFVIIALIFCTMVGYTALVIHLETQEKNNDWKNNCLPIYPRVRRYLDEEILQVCPCFPFKSRCLHIYLHI
ncbi:unnamed protein product [Toxocara canis]|uniref:Secreted protein n=1 Tax=Toxocara canis TaxID=6265 RepID=A0A183U6W1_TOXCA|nr:unnamed protein product [Toxocara canis]